MTDTTILLARLRPVLQDRREVVARQWRQALATTGFVALSSAETNEQLLALTDRASATLCGEDFEPAAARDLGAALVDLGYRDPAALGRTLDVLGATLLADLPSAWFVALQPRLLLLLSDLAAGFSSQVQALARAQQVRLLDALHESQAQLRVVVEHAPIILFALDPQGTITLFEGQGLAVLGYQPGALVGQPVWRGAVTVPRLPELLTRALAGDEFTASVTVRGVTLVTHYRPLRDDAGVVTGVLGVATDVTAQIQAEAALRRLEAGLSQREVTLLRLLADPALTYEAIAKQHKIEWDTVRSHVRHIAAKLRVPSQRAAVVAAARRGGWLDEPGP